VRFSCRSSELYLLQCCVTNDNSSRIAGSMVSPALAATEDRCILRLRYFVYYCSKHFLRAPSTNILKISPYDIDLTPWRTRSADFLEVISEINKKKIPIFPLFASNCNVLNALHNAKESRKIFSISDYFSTLEVI